MNRLFFILFLLTSLSCGSLESDIANIYMPPYISGVWDCSEMSFYLQHKLEELGYNAQVAQTIGDPGHSWVMVITDTEVITVEATLMKIMPFRSDWDKLFRNATDAMNHCVSESEVDWWNYHAIK